MFHDWEAQNGTQATCPRLTLKYYKSRACLHPPFLELSLRIIVISPEPFLLLSDFPHIIISSQSQNSELVFSALFGFSLPLYILIIAKVLISKFKKIKHGSLKSRKSLSVLEISYNLHLETKTGFENLSLRSESRIFRLHYPIGNPYLSQQPNNKQFFFFPFL